MVCSGLEPRAAGVKAQMNPPDHGISLLNGPTRHIFVYFRSFQTQILQKNYWLQRDSNSDRRSRRLNRQTKVITFYFHEKGDKSKDIIN